MRWRSSQWYEDLGVIDNVHLQFKALKNEKGLFITKVAFLLCSWTKCHGTGFHNLTNTQLQNKFSQLPTTGPLNYEIRLPFQRKIEDGAKYGPQASEIWSNFLSVAACFLLTGIEHFFTLCSSKFIKFGLQIISWDIGFLLQFNNLFIFPCILYTLSENINQPSQAFLNAIEIFSWLNNTLSLRPPCLFTCCAVTVYMFHRLWDPVEVVYFNMNNNRLISLSYCVPNSWKRYLGFSRQFMIHCSLGYSYTCSR